MKHPDIKIEGQQTRLLIDTLTFICSGPREAYCLLISALVALNEDPECLEAGEKPYTREQLANKVRESILGMRTEKTSS